MNFKEWLKALPTSPTASQAADAAKVSRATALRHEAKGQTTAEYAIKISRAYDVNEIQALIDLGFVDEAAVLDLAVEKALGYAKNSQLWIEMSKRDDPEKRRLFRAEGRPGVIDLDDDVIESPDAQVFNFPTPNVDPLDDDEMPEAAVAYSGPDEDALRQEDDVD